MTARPLIDISPPIDAAIAVWPGDVPFRREVACDLDAGAHMTLSAITSTLHLGAHADAPNHYVRGAPGIGERPLDLYYGPCQVMRVQVAPHARIQPADLPEPVRAPRLLLHTGSQPDANAFPTDFASLSPALVEHLAAADVVLVGIDTPSVDPFDDKLLESHHALARHGMANLEGLRLGHVEPGLYLLIALPLALRGADASPVRAALAPLPPTAGGSP
ncbi:MAG: cyclase family protein [Deltaproteobacteria bacterium]|nr:cyclase family protein [Deltaproteobacteria bacterium]MCB9788816.1 cyclase family protein [Deltaproteobacteria bacterium]